MAEYMNKETFLAYMGLKGDETKYGNRDGEHMHRSYSTYMSYEIMDGVEDSIEENVAPVRHGRWVEHEFEDEPCFGTEYECSACGKIQYRNSKYCPNCGAKMDEEV